MSASTSTLKSNPKRERKKNPEFLSEKPEQQALAAAAIGSLKIPSFLQQQTSFSEAYGSTGLGVFKRGIYNWKDFYLRINILKGSY